MHRIRHGLWTIATNVAWCVCLCVCVCLLITTVSHAKTAESTKMLFGRQARGVQETMAVHIGATWQIRLNDPWAMAMLPYV